MEDKVALLETAFDNAITRINADGFVHTTLCDVERLMDLLASTLRQPAFEEMAAEMLVDLATLIRVGHLHDKQAIQLMSMATRKLVFWGDEKSNAGTAPWIVRNRYIDFQNAARRCDHCLRLLTTWTLFQLPEGVIFDAG